MTSERRRQLQEQQDEALTTHPGTAYCRRILAFGPQRDLDVDQLLEISSQLQHDINLTRWRGHPEVKAAVERARAATREAAELAVNVFWAVPGGQ